MAGTCQQPERSKDIFAEYFVDRVWCVRLELMYTQRFINLSKFLALRKNENHEKVILGPTKILLLVCSSFLESNQ